MTVGHPEASPEAGRPWYDPVERMVQSRDACLDPRLEELMVGRVYQVHACFTWRG